MDISDNVQNELDKAKVMGEGGGWLMAGDIKATAKK